MSKLRLTYAPECVDLQIDEATGSATLLVSITQAVELALSTNTSTLERLYGCMTEAMARRRESA